LVALGLIERLKHNLTSCSATDDTQDEIETLYNISQHASVVQRIIESGIMSYLNTESEFVSKKTKLIFRNVFTAPGVDFNSIDANVWCKMLDFSPKYSDLVNLALAIVYSRQSEFKHKAEVISRLQSMQYKTRMPTDVLKAAERALNALLEKEPI
jgi:hypothetical protein